MSAPEGERLQKVLARSGVASRRGCEDLIRGGRVLVDGEVATLGSRVDPATARIVVDGVPVVTDTSLVHVLLNKPRGVVTTARDPQGRPTVMDLVPRAPRLFPVGRLDRDSEGLLILTNDGELAELLTHPRYGVEKEYLAEVAGVPTRATLRRVREGVELDDGPAHAERVHVVQEAGDRTHALVAVVVTEGRKRLVRRLFAKVGHPVRRLVRTRIGPVVDRHLAPGEWRPLDQRELRALYTSALGGTDDASG